MENSHDHASDVRRIVLVIKDLAASHGWPLESEDVKARCARLGLRYDGGLVYQALERVEQERRRLGLDRAAAPRRPADEGPGSPFSRDLAGRFLARLRAKLDAPVGVKPMPPAPKPRPVNADARLRAARIVAAAIAEQVAVVDHLESSL